MSTFVSREEISRALREYVLNEFLPGEDPAALTDATPLISGGILDSIGVTRLVTHLEAQYAVQFESAEMNVDNLDTIPLIVSAVEQKLNHMG